jgi:hypothetical protein
MKATDEAARKEILAQMGIEDESVDLNIYTESLQQDLSVVMNINNTLKAYVKTNFEVNVDSKGQDTEEIIRGIKFE